MNIKQQDLHEITRELVDATLDIDRPNREKICDFILNLSNNGGHKQRAAIEAGYGDQTPSGMSTAAAEATRLLKDVKIAAVYEKLQRIKFSEKILAKSLSKDHYISLYYQIAISCADKNLGQAIKALKEAATLSGYYADDALSTAVQAMEKAENAEQLLLTAQKLFDKHPEVLS